MAPVLRLAAVFTTALAFTFAGSVPDAAAQDKGAPKTKPGNTSRPLLTNRKGKNGRVRWWQKLRRIHEAGEYGGVTPGVLYPYSNFKTWKRPFNRHATRGRPRLTWVGFQPKKDGSARVFFQLTRDTPVSQRLEKGVLIVTLEGARFRRRNTRRKLDTRYFDTAIFGIKARRVHARRAHKDRPARKAGIEVRITFKNAADAREGKISRAVLKDKFSYVFLDFGPGTPAAKSSNGG